MNTNIQGKTIDILLVEDNIGDARLAQEALKEAKVRNNLYIVGDGEEALDFLQKKGKYAGVPQPDLILLDLNLPKKNGEEVLEEIKSNDELRNIPVVILTVSKSEEDISRAYNLHANCYITKPLNLDQFIEVIKNINEFWLAIVKLPPNDRESRLAR